MRHTVGFKRGSVRGMPPGPLIAMGAGDGLDDDTEADDENFREIWKIGGHMAIGLLCIIIGGILCVVAWGIGLLPDSLAVYE